MMVIEVPLGWKTKLLKELLEVQNGYAFASDQFSHDCGMPLIRIRDLKGSWKTEIKFKGKYDPKFVVKSGDLLIGMDGEFRCYKWQGPDALLNQRVCRLVNFHENIMPEFILYGINSHLKTIEDNTPFVTVRHLSAKKIKGISFSYPSLPEQQRIVARIKECMDRVDEIEQLRTEESLEIDATLPSLLSEQFSAIAERCETFTIDELSIETRYGTSKKCTTDEIGTPILRIPNVAGGFVNRENLKYCNLSDRDKANLVLKDGDLLFVRTNGSRDLVGRCAIFNTDANQTPYGFASYLIRIRLDIGKILPQYLAFFLNSTLGRVELDKRKKTSAGQFNINSTNLRTIPVPLPPIDEQVEIVKELKEQEGVVLRLQHEFKGAKEREAKLRESILRKAFAGEL